MFNENQQKEEETETERKENSQLKGRETIRDCKGEAKAEMKCH